MADSWHHYFKLAKFMETRSKEVLMADRISELPDEVLQMILSRLSLREAVGTSVLSHRWKDMWAYTTGSLNFQFTSSKLLLVLPNREIVEAEKELYIRKVNKFLSAHKGLTIEAFRVSFYLELSNKLDIDNWIEFALRKKVRRLELDFTRPGDRNSKELYPFPKGNLPDMSCLKSLHLQYVDLTSEILQYVLSNCLSLGFLSIRGSDSLVSAKILAPCLKHLEISHCTRLKLLHISSAEKLTSLQYYGNEFFDTRLCFQNVPNLVNISLGGRNGINIIERFDQQPVLLSHIKKIVLCMHLEYPVFGEFPELKNVMELELKFNVFYYQNLLSCASLVEACPNLCRFSMQFSSFAKPEKRELQRRENCCTHKCLKVVELLNFQGTTTSEVELATYLLSNAPYLEKIIVNTITPFSMNTKSSMEMFFSNKTYLEENASAKECVQQLAQLYSPNAELIILTKKSYTRQK